MHFPCSACVLAFALVSFASRVAESFSVHHGNGARLDLEPEKKPVGDIAKSSQPPVVTGKKERRHTAGNPSVIHFLFLLKDEADLITATVWREFFAGAPANNYRIFGHCSEACDKEKVRFLLPEMLLVDQVPSSYCMDVVTPMAALLKVAVNYTSPLSASMDKFVFVSGTTLPTKPFPVLFRALTKHPQSDICILSPNEWAAAAIDGKTYRVVKHSQWVVLNKVHAFRFVKYWEPNVWQHEQARNSKWRVNISPQRAVPRELFSAALGTPGAHCTDEEAVFATLFGAVEEVDWGETSRTYNRLGRVELAGHIPHQVGLGKCHTYVAWETKPGSLAGFIHSDEDSEIPSARDANDFSHPLEFQRLSSRALAAIRAHPALFIRKISDGADLSKYASVVFSDEESDFTGYNVPVVGQIRVKASKSDEKDRCLAVEEKSLRLIWDQCIAGSVSNRFVVPESGAGLIRFGYFGNLCLSAQAPDAASGSWIVLVECADANLKGASFIIPTEPSKKIRWEARPSVCLDSVPTDLSALRLSDCDRAHAILPPRLSYAPDHLF